MYILYCLDCRGEQREYSEMHNLVHIYIYIYKHTKLLSTQDTRQIRGARITSFIKSVQEIKQDGLCCNLTCIIDCIMNVRMKVYEMAARRLTLNLLAPTTVGARINP